MRPSLNAPPTEVLVLGGPHLGPATSDATLARTLAHLKAWAPAAVAIEWLPGELVDLYTREGGAYEMVQVGGLPTAVRLGQLAHTYRGWTRPQAAEVAVAPNTAPADRVLAWLLALEPMNALLHWSPGLDLPTDVQSAMTSLAAEQDEVTRLAVPLARHLGIARLEHFDDHTGIEIMARIGETWTAGLEAIGYGEIIERRPSIRAARVAGQSAREQGDLWPLYRFMNSPETVRDTLDLETGTMLRAELPGGEHRARVAQWDARNLFMAARLRVATAGCPGGRLLAVVGSSHKGPLEAALRALGPDLRLVLLSELESEVT